MKLGRCQCRCECLARAESKIRIGHRSWLWGIRWSRWVNLCFGCHDHYQDSAAKAMRRAA